MFAMQDTLMTKSQHAAKKARITETEAELDDELELI
jgi:hypothetical protein